MNLNTAIHDAIAKGTARATRKPMASLRRDLAQIKREVAELKRQLRTLGKISRSRVERPAPAAEPAKPLRMRPTGPMVRSLRQKLGLTQARFAKLAGVSALTVCKWEKVEGRIRMRGPAAQGFARVRAMGPREAKKALTEE